MPQLLLADASLKNTIDVKANGEASRMRSHKGVFHEPHLTSPDTEQEHSLLNYRR